ncbi:hybrid sensor histidine kinase/response regulator [Thiocystis violacea]|uniref:hybrid sensor histidine kinase/response regulator n=1 Tax=Thiocystis violacea TaxID=13725 RepID=UPI001907009E|nr:response regulator [Thiocystis violacea]MBK1721829.1 hypothetical protein [Thiocystis violacea]
MARRHLDREGLMAAPTDDPGGAGTAALRQRAESRLSQLESLAETPADAEDVARLFHELRVHQIELELQNEELRRTQDALALAHTRYFDLYDLAPVGYLTLSERGLISEANLAAAKLMGTTRQDLVRRPICDWVMPDDQDLYYRSRRRLDAAQPQQRCELRLRRPDGSSLWVALILSLQPERETGALQCLLVLSDIDAHMRFEALQREEAERKEDFLALLGHELRNPLAPIRHIAEVLGNAEGQPPARLAPMAGILMRQSAHLARLVDDLLDISRINRGGIVLERAPCDLRHCATSAVEQIHAQVEARQQRLEVELPPDPVVLNGDAVRLTQAIVNLLRNASELSPPASPIRVSLVLANGIATLEVCDQGEGLEPDSLEKVFEPLARRDGGGGARRGGLGMGLTLVRGLIELHGGTVGALSPGLGQGSTFQIRLPCPADRTSTHAPTLDPVSLPVRRVLLVEDDPDVANGCVLLLSLLGQEVEWAADGPAALQALERFRPDLILLDLGLPGMDGFEVARRLRATEAGRSARLVAVTGWGQAKDVDDTRQLGFDAHFTKPLKRDTLMTLLAGGTPPRSHQPASSARKTSDAPGR